MILLLISALPVFLIMIYLYQRDKYEKEPFGMLVRALAGGMLAAVAVILVMSPFDEDLLDSGNLFMNSLSVSFLMAAIPEETFKFIFFLLFIWRNRNFNEKYDGILYAAFVSLGFALLENILYVFFMGGIKTGIIRALTAIPAHAMFGIVMGYFISLARFNPSKRTGYLALALGYAILLHGLYDFLAMMVNGLLEINHVVAFLVFAAFVFFMVRLYRFVQKKIQVHVKASEFR